jgi:hypothetical protein
VSIRWRLVLKAGVIAGLSFVLAVYVTSSGVLPF